MNGFDRRAMFALAAGGVAQAGLAYAQAPSQEMASGIQHVEVNGTKLAYEPHSQGSGRRPLVFGHGYALRGTGVMYSPLISRLAAEFDVYALDMRGHGASAASFAGWSQAAIADDLAAFVEKLGLRGAAYAGHSLGGFTGMFT